MKVMGDRTPTTYWGEAFIRYERGDHMLKVGRQEIADYRFVSLSNIRMTPVTHQGTI